MQPIGGTPRCVRVRSRCSRLAPPPVNCRRPAQSRRGRGGAQRSSPSPSLSPNEVAERASLSSGEKTSLSRHGDEPDPAPPRHRTPRHSIVDTTAGAGTRLPGTTPHRRFDVPCHALRAGASASPGRPCGTRDTPRRGVICSSSSRAHASSPSVSSKTTQGTGSSPERVAAERHLDVQRVGVGFELRESERREHHLPSPRLGSA